MPKSKGVAIVQIACGFDRRPQGLKDFEAVSAVDQARRERVLQLYAELVQTSELEVWTSGEVGWDPIGRNIPTLAILNQRALTTAVPGVFTERVPGLNAFSESWNACQQAKLLKIDRLVVVSSDFYWQAYRPLWLASARRAGVQLEIISLIHPEGLVSGEVRAFYQSLLIKLVTLVASSSLFGHWMSKALVDLKTRDRVTKGFRVDGHRMIS